MNISRRAFFRGISSLAITLAAAHAANPAAAALFPESSRMKTWRLLNEAELALKTEGKKASVAKITELLEFMLEHFPITSPPSKQEMVRDCRDLLYNQGVYEGGAGYNDGHWRTCYPSTFAVMIVRDGLKDRKLPMVQARNWKWFARKYTEIVMAA